MPEIAKCKHCGGQGKHRNGETCTTCQGSGHVIITIDDDGRRVVTPAVRQ